MKLSENHHQQKNQILIVLGRTTFETVCGFDMDWPYQKPVFVLSNTLTGITEKSNNKAPGYIPITSFCFFKLQTDREFKFSISDNLKNKG
jgi:hypothetical protein